MAKASEWSKRVAEWRSSGLTASAFAAGRGFAPSTLRWWASRLGAVASESDESPSATRFVRVERVADAGDAGLIVEIGDARVLVPQGADYVTLTSVLEALSARGAR